MLSFFRKAGARGQDRTGQQETRSSQTHTREHWEEAVTKVADRRCSLICCMSYGCMSCALRGADSDVQPAASKTTRLVCHAQAVKHALSLCIQVLRN